MDMYVERIIKKEKSIYDTIFKITVVFVAAALFCIVISIPIHMIITLSPAFLAIIVYLAYRLIISRNIEFEYTVTNGDLDVDIIVAQRKRKRIFSANCADFIIIASIDSDKYDEDAKRIEKRIDTTSSPNSSDIYFAIVNKGKGKAIIFFEPNEKMLNTFKAFMPKKVLL